MFANGLFPLIDKPTRISTTATLLDNIWTNNYTCSCKSATFTDSISDHFAVYQCTQLPTSILRISSAKNVRIFNEVNIYKFQELSNEVSWNEVYEQVDLDLAFTTFLEILKIKYNEAFLIVIRNNPKSKINGWYDTELCSLQKEKWTVYLRFLRNNNPESQLAYHKIRNHYKRVIETKKSQYFQKLFSSCQNDLKRTWSVINDIIGKKTSTSPNCLKHNDKLITDPIEIAELFNDHFSSIASKLRAKLNSPPNSMNLNFKSNSSKISSSFFFMLTTAYTVKKLCKFCYSCLVEKLLFLQVKHFTGICSKCCEFYYFCQVNSLPACKQRNFSGNSSKLGKIYMYCLARKNTRLHVDFTYFSEKLCLRW